MQASITESVLSRVAEREGVGPEDLDPPLYRVVNCDALNDLFRSTTGTVQFSYHGYRVAVDDDGFVTVRDADDA